MGVEPGWTNTQVNMQLSETTTRFLVSDHNLEMFLSFISNSICDTGVEERKNYVLLKVRVDRVKKWTHTSFANFLINKSNFLVIYFPLF